MSSAPTPPAHASSRGSRFVPLRRAFFARDTVAVARDLLGHILVHNSPEGLSAGRIVEAEAYLGPKDPASHAYRRTPRSSIMYGRPGFAYVYFSYGNHFCINVVTEREEMAGAVLLRALEPLEGIEVMMERRGVTDIRLLCSGPGRLAEAMGITRDQNSADLTRPPLYVAHGRPGVFVIGTSARVGISQAAEKPWRFYIKGNPHVSRR